jgi:hypothetical protein
MIIPPLRMLVPPPSVEFYSTKVMNGDWERVHNPSAIYVSSTNKTILSWSSVGVSGDKCIQVAEFDHATNAWSRRYNAGNYTLADDNHGYPGLVRDASGYIHIFFGSHDSDQHWSSTNSPDDIAAWTQHAPLTTDQTYPHPLLVGSTLYLFLRNGTAFPDNATLSLRTCTPSGGTGTFTAQADIIDFDDGTGGRVYQGEAHVVGTDIHFTCTRSDEIDSFRQHIYYFVYKTTTGAIENHDGSVSVASGSLPISLATADASFRLVAFAGGSAGKGDVPSLTFDTSGNPHIIYAYNGGSGTAYTLEYITKSAGVWSSPATLATVFDIAPGSGLGTAFVTNYCLVPGAAGTVEAWYVDTNGSKLRRIRSASGVWSAAQLILTAGSLKLIGQQAVRDAHPNLRSIFSEVVSGSASDAAAVLGKRYGYGDSGMVNFGMPAAGSIDSLWTNVAIMLGFDHRDTVPRAINESDSGLVVTFNGNAQIDTAQSVFSSGGSLLLDGTGDYIQLANNSLFSIASGDFTVECWVRRNASKLQCVCTKKPTSGSSEWALFVNASNQLQGQAFNATVAVINISSTATIANATWTHVALARQGSTWRIFVGGNLEASATESPGAPTSNSRPLLIGRDEAFPARDFNGWIDEFRFTPGSARYTASFTAPSAVFPRI